MPPKSASGGPKQKALEKQMQNEAMKQEKSRAEAEKADAAAWSVGAKDNSKAKAAEDKEAEKRRKAAEKSALEAAEDAENSTVFRVTKTKKKGKDDFDLLNAALAQQPKTKAQKEAEAKKKEQELKKKKEQEAQRLKDEQKKADAEYAKKAAAKGVVLNHSDALMVPINNTLEDDEIDASGLSSAVDALSGALSGATVDEHPERRQKALYNAYFEAQLPILKEEHPGLKLSQYKDRIFQAWKKSPENPANQTA